MYRIIKCYQIYILLPWNEFFLTIMMKMEIFLRLFMTSRYTLANILCFYILDSSFTHMTIFEMTELRPRSTIATLAYRSCEIKWRISQVEKWSQAVTQCYAIIPNYISVVCMEASPVLIMWINSLSTRPTTLRHKKVAIVLLTYRKLHLLWMKWVVTFPCSWIGSYSMMRCVGTLFKN